MRVEYCLKIGQCNTSYCGTTSLGAGLSSDIITTQRRFAQFDNSICQDNAMANAAVGAEKLNAALLNSKQADSVQSSH